MDYNEKINTIFKDEQTRRAVRSMIADERLKNVVLGWMHLPHEKRVNDNLYQDMIVREWNLKLSKN